MSKNNKYKKTIIGGVAVLIASGSVWGISQLLKEKPELAIKSDITFKKNQFSYINAINMNSVVTDLPIINPEDVIDVRNSKYEIISFNKPSIAKENPGEIDTIFLKTDEVGKFEGKVYAILGNQVKEYTFTYKVEE